MGTLRDPWDGDHRGLGNHKSGRRSGVGCAIWLLTAGSVLVEALRRVIESLT